MKGYTLPEKWKDANHYSQAELKRAIASLAAKYPLFKSRDKFSPTDICPCHFINEGETIQGTDNIIRGIKRFPGNELGRRMKVSGYKQFAETLDQYVDSPHAEEIHAIGREVYLTDNSGAIIHGSGTNETDEGREFRIELEAVDAVISDGEDINADTRSDLIGYFLDQQRIISMEPVGICEGKILIKSAQNIDGTVLYRPTAIQPVDPESQIFYLNEQQTSPDSNYHSLNRFSDILELLPQSNDTTFNSQETLSFPDGPCPISFLAHMSPLQWIGQDGQRNHIHKADSHINLAERAFTHLWHLHQLERCLPESAQHDDGIYIDPFLVEYTGKTLRLGTYYNKSSETPDRPVYLDRETPDEVYEFRVVDIDYTQANLSQWGEESQEPNPSILESKMPVAEPLTSYTGKTSSPLNPVVNVHPDENQITISISTKMETTKIDSITYGFPTLVKTDEDGMRKGTPTKTSENA